MKDLYAKCSQCPRRCSADRNSSVLGYCRESSKVKIASACLHFGEEPPVTVFNGSGTIFFTGCTLRCSFCQNYQISQQGMGAEISEKDFVSICLKLQEKGAENINLITGSHHIPLIAKYLGAAKSSGLSIPVAWNSSAYESVEMLELLKDVVDIWLPDLKTLNPDLSKKLFGAEDYPEVATAAIRWMLRNFPPEMQETRKDDEVREKMTRGVIIRHLFLPGRIEETVDTLRWLKDNADEKAYISLMSQYTPVPFSEEQNTRKERLEKLSAIENRLVTAEEDETLRDLIEIYDFSYLFYQDLSDDDTWLPDFRRTQPFSYELAKPVWHWSSGFQSEANT